MNGREKRVLCQQARAVGPRHGRQVLAVRGAGEGL